MEALNHKNLKHYLVNKKIENNSKAKSNFPYEIVGMVSSIIWIVAILLYLIS